MNDREGKRVVIWLPGGVTILFLPMGFGIIAPDIITPITFGVLG